jgi:hypothetical protein
MNVSLASYDFRRSALLLSIRLQYLRASSKLSSNIASLQLGSEQLEALRVDSIHHIILPAPYLEAGELEAETMATKVVSITVVPDYSWFQ